MPCHFAAVADRTCVDDCTGLRNFLVRPMCIGSYDGAEDYDETDPEDDGPPWDEDGEK